MSEDQTPRQARLKAIKARLTVNRRQFAAFLAGASAAAALPAAAQAQAAPRRGGILKVSAPTNPSSLDPATGGAGTDHAFLYSIFDTLVEWDYTGLTAKPGLAKSWKFTDPTTLVMDLQPGVLFHDGTPCDAAAVKFNLDRNRSDQRSNIKVDLGTVESVEASGPLQVTLKLKRPDSALPLILSDRAGMMSSPKAVQELGREHDRKPIGTGAWKLAAWNDNEKVSVVRNEKYWKQGQPYLDGIDYNIITEINTGLRSVTAGQNDFIYFLSPQQKQIIDRARNLTAVSGPTLYCIQMFFNFGRPPFDEQKVRLAFNMAIDREAYSKATMAGLAETATTTLPRAHWAFDPALDGFYKYDPDRARALLAEAGHKDGIEIHGVGYSDQRSQQRQEVIIEQVRKAGFRLRFSTGSIPEISAGFFGREKRGDLLLAAWTGRPDPSLTFQLMFARESYFNAGSREVSPELTAAMNDSRGSEDLAARKKAFTTVQRLVLEQALCCPLVFQYELNAHVAKVKGYKANLLGKPKFETVWLEG